MSVLSRVSVALPVYNGERYLSQAITSILAQTYRDFELIISDNASTPATEDICRRFEASDPRVRYVRQSRNIGASPNFNIGYELASGEYFKWAAHEPEYLAECVRALDANPDAVLCHSMVRLLDSQDRLVEVFRPIEPAATTGRPSERFAARMHNPRRLDIWGVIRREALRNSVLIGSYIGMDRALLLELALRGRFLLIDRPLFTNRDHPERATRVTRTQTRKDLIAVYDTANAGRTVLSTWIKESAGIIRRNLTGTNNSRHNDFETAWRLSAERAEGRMVAATCRAPRYLDYRAIGRLGEQVTRLKTLVPERQLHAIVFDDLRADPRAVHRETLAFIDVPVNGQRAFPIVNARKTNAWPALARFPKRPPAPLHRLKLAAKRAFPAQAKAIGSVIHRLNQRPEPRQALGEAMYGEMIAAFKDDINLLELLNRDLTQWHQAQPALRPPRQK